MSTGVVLVIFGVACLALCGFLFWKLLPQDGQPPSKWTGTDARGTVVAMSMLMLLIAGLGLVAKGIF